MNELLLVAQHGVGGESYRELQVTRPDADVHSVIVHARVPDVPSEAVPALARAVRALPNGDVHHRGTEGTEDGDTATEQRRQQA